MSLGLTRVRSQVECATKSQSLLDATKSRLDDCRFSSSDPKLANLNERQCAREASTARSLSRRNFIE